MRYRAEVVTKWVEATGPGGEPVRRFELTPDLFAGKVLTVTDLTRQQAEQVIPDPNSVTVEVICDGETLDLIEADGRFTVLSVTTEYVENADPA